MPAIVHLTDTFNVYSFIAEKCWTRAIMRRTCRFICSVRLLLLPSQQPFFPFLLGSTQATTGYGNEILMKSSGSRKTAPSSGGGWARGHVCARGRTPAGRPELGQLASRCAWRGPQAAGKGRWGCGRSCCVHAPAKASPFVRGWPAIDCKTRSQSWFLKKYI